MKTYNYSKNKEWMQRALKVCINGVQGHLGPGEACMSPITAYPFFAEKAEGAYIWDVDGNKFIDYMCAYGPNVLGYGDKDVNAAAVAQLAFGDCTTQPSTKMVECAELLVNTVASADWAFFAKNGGDVTSYATMIARAYKQRKKMIFIKGYYHGVAPWTQKADCPGVLVEDVVNNIQIEWNNIEQLKEVVARYKGQIAGLIAMPYMQGNFVDNILPAEGYWKEVRRICTENDIVLILDDVRCGFRLDLAGSDHFYGFEADLICFCKALANGWNMSALCGKEFLKGSAGNVMFTGSYWLSAVPFAACIACLTKLKELDAPKKLREMGLKLTNGLAKAAKDNGVNLVISGEPAMFYLRVADDDTLELHQEWNSECVRRGVYFTSHHNHFMNMAMTDADIEQTIKVADECFKLIVKNHPEVYKK